MPILFKLDSDLLTLKMAPILISQRDRNALNVVLDLLTD